MRTIHPIEARLPISCPPVPVAFAQPTEVLSPSQVRYFMDCQIRWWFKYGLKIPDAPTGNMALGRAVHSALCENFAQKVDTREDLPTPGVVALFRDAWANEREQTEFRDEENPQELAATGEALVTRYMDYLAPAIDPAVVELKVEGEIGGVRVQGWIDLLDVEGRVIDIKTAKARPSSVEPMHKFQVATYSQLIPGASGEGRIDTLVKTKTPQVISQNFQVTAERDESRANTLSRCSRSNAPPALHAEPTIHDVLPTKLLLLAPLRTGMGR